MTTTTDTLDERLLRLLASDQDNRRVPGLEVRRTGAVR
jgi:hypothetical protein